MNTDNIFYKNMESVLDINLHRHKPDISQELHIVIIIKHFRNIN